MDVGGGVPSRLNKVTGADLTAPLPRPQNTQVWGPRSCPSSSGLQAACQALDMNTPPQ